VVKIAQSLYREAPGMDPFRPDQRTPVPNFYLAGSYTKQVRRPAYRRASPYSLAHQALVCITLFLPLSLFQD